MIIVYYTYKSKLIENSLTFENIHNGENAYCPKLSYTFVGGQL